MVVAPACHGHPPVERFECPVEADLKKMVDLVQERVGRMAERQSASLQEELTAPLALAAVLAAVKARMERKMAFLQPTPIENRQRQVTRQRGRWQGRPQFLWRLRRIARSDTKNENAYKKEIKSE